jgi:HlyD family secretion protein
MRETLHPKTGAPTTDGVEHTNGWDDLSAGDTTLAIPTSASRYADEVQMLPPRRRRWRGALAVVLVLAIALVGGYFLLRPAESAPFATVRRDTIVSTVETTGKVQAERSARLSFKVSGRVEKVLVSQGDRVEAGDVLAELDTNAQQRQLAEAQAQLEISKLKLQQAREGARPEDVAAATANLNAAQARLSQVRSGARAEDVAVAQALLNQAQAKLEAIKKGASPEEIAAGQALLDQAKANRDLVAVTAANETEQARMAMVQAGATTQDWLDPEGRIEQARLNYEAAKEGEVLQLQAADAKVAEAQAAFDALKAGPTAEELLVAEEDVKQARAAFDKARAGATPDEIREADAGVAAAQAALDKAGAGPTGTDVAILEQQIALSQLAVDRAESQVGDARLVAPMSGTLLSIDIEPGENVNGQQAVATVADIDDLRINADVDEIDVGRVKAGQPVTVTLDAYPGVRMAGRIETIDPGATLKQGSTVYRATISFTPGEEVVAREGMAANVDITAQRKDGVLLLPNRAFETVGGRQYVTLAAEGNPKVEVETGLTNSTDTEVISGVEEGQVVLIT